LNFALKLEELSMKKLVIASLVSGAFVVPALAADLARPPVLYQAPPAPLPIVSSWTGFYIGSNFGWIGSMDNTITKTGTDNGTGGLGTYLSFGGIPATVSASHSNFLGGGQIGYNWQWGPSWVMGLEADFDGIASPSSTVIAAFPGNAAFFPAQSGFARALDTLGTVRGRVGYLISPSFLWYATGGLAYGETKLQTAFACAACAPPVFTERLTDDWQVGWTVGAGVEWRFAPQWSVKAEYLYVDLGSISNTIGYPYGPFNSTLTSTYSEHDNIVRAGINYKFW
jgi:outer membrane immunogenic protein